MNIDDRFYIDGESVVFPRANLRFHVSFVNNYKHCDTYRKFHKQAKKMWHKRRERREIANYLKSLGMIKGTFRVTS